MRQWEDCGPWVTDDWEFVFGTKPPKNHQNGAGGIDISPAMRDYLGMKSGEKVHWRFVEAGQVPYGPWKKYGRKPPPSPAIRIWPPSSGISSTCGNCATNNSSRNR